MLISNVNRITPPEKLLRLFRWIYPDEVVIVFYFPKKQICKVEILPKELAYSGDLIFLAPPKPVMFNFSISEYEQGILVTRLKKGEMVVIDKVNTTFYD